MYREFEGGYATTKSVDAILFAKRTRKLSKQELRLFFAELENTESGNRVGVDFLLNGPHPKRRISEGKQEKARKRLNQAVVDFKPDRELSTKIPRKFARAAAKGALDVSEMIAALFYFRWRKPQRRRRKLVQRGERYASFTFEQASQVTGLARSTLCKAFKVLRNLKVVAVAWRPMQQIKLFGMLFVDGVALNLYCRKDERYRGSNPWKRRQKMRTQPTKKKNANRLTLPNNSFRSSAENNRDVIGAFAAKYCPRHPRAEAYALRRK